jgi:hypothetical protein
LSPINPIINSILSSSVSPPILPLSLYNNYTTPTANIYQSAGIISLTTTPGSKIPTMEIGSLNTNNGGNYACLLTLWSANNDAAKTVITNIISITVTST